MVRKTSSYRTNGTGFSTVERFWKFTRKLLGKNACWVWIGTKTDRKVPHGRFFVEGKNVLPHRFAYQEWIGPIPEGFDAHHTCGNPWCVNPAHLQLLQHGAHASLTHKGRPKPHKTHCPRGHPLSGDNLLSNGKFMWCRECRRIHQWCLRHGLRISEFTPKQLAALVPLRARKAAPRT
jgi:hypothetical protein